MMGWLVTLAICGANDDDDVDVDDGDDEECCSFSVVCVPL